MERLLRMVDRLQILPRESRMIRWLLATVLLFSIVLWGVALVAFYVVSIVEPGWIALVN
jgi:hypothetical protein